LKLQFTKMHGAGNDYVYINCFFKDVPSPEALAITISDRHFGIGSDGLVLICPSNIADAKMRMFNADGSESQMCGNAIRCVGKYLFENSMIQKQQLSIETLSGIKYLQLETVDNIVKSVTVNMGKAILEAKAIPVISNEEQVISQPILVDGAEYKVTCVSMGNPHCVIFVDNADEINIEKIGPLFEFNEAFPQRINAEFVELLNGNTIKMRVWERGSGETLACGTGACASVVACVLNGKCKIGENIRVLLKGGELSIKYMQDGTVYMTGDATKVFDGEINIEGEL